jgi:hypothetical protein
MQNILVEVSLYRGINLHNTGKIHPVRNILLPVTVFFIPNDGKYC